MSTSLIKPICRESKEKLDDGRNIVVCLTSDQKIVLKPKGSKSTGTITFGIKELYERYSKPQNTEPVTKREPVVIVKNKTTNPEEQMLFSLYDFRSKYLTSADFSYEIKTKLEMITTGLINERKK